MLRSRSEFLDYKGFQLYFRYMDTKVFSTDESYIPLPSVEYNMKYFEFLDEVHQTIKEKFSRYIGKTIFPDIKYCKTVMNEGPRPFGVAAYVDGSNAYLKEAVRRNYIQMVVETLFEDFYENRNNIIPSATIKLDSYGGPYFYEFMKDFLDKYYKDDIRYLTRLVVHAILGKDPDMDSIPFSGREKYDQILNMMSNANFGAVIKTRSQFNSFTCNEDGECKPKNRKTYIPGGDHVIEVEQMMQSQLYNGYSAAKRRHVTAFDKHFTIFSAIRVTKVLLDAQLYLYPNVFITKGPDDLSLKIRGKYVVGTDTSQFDKGLNKEVLDQYLKVIGLNFKGTEQEWDLFVKSHFPDLITAWDADSVFVDSYDSNKGWYLLSGLSETTLLGHCCGLAVAMVVLEDVFNYKWNKDLLRKFLRWELDVKLKNKGDDTLWIFEKKEDKELFLNSIDMEYLEPQVADEFIGLKVVEAEDGSVADVIHDVVRSWFNFLNPESSANSPWRKCLWIGYEERSKSIKHPFVGEIKEMIEEIFLRHYGYSLHSAVMRTKARCNLNYSTLNQDEIQFLQNPELVFYKIDPRNIRPEIFNQFFLPITPKDVSDALLI